MDSATTLKLKKAGENPSVQYLPGLSFDCAHGFTVHLQRDVAISAVGILWDLHVNRTRKLKCLLSNIQIDWTMRNCSYLITLYLQKLEIPYSLTKYITNPANYQIFSAIFLGLSLCVRQGEIQLIPSSFTHTHTHTHTHTLPAVITNWPSTQLQLPFVMLNPFPATGNLLSVIHCLRMTGETVQKHTWQWVPHTDGKSVRNNGFSG